MFKKFNLAIFVLIFFVLIGSVSAVDDNATDMDDVALPADEAMAVEEIPVDEALETSGSHTINSGNYLNYFDNKGNLVPSTVNDGDTIYLEGSFSNCKFTFSKPVNIVGTSTNNLKNSVVTILKGGSGSSITGLNIANTNDNTFGIFINSASYCSIQNCFINNTGVASHCIAVGNGANYNNITDNFVACYGITYGHGGTRSTTPLIVSGSHYNSIINNYALCDDANGIYLSAYNHDPLKGGVCNYNVVYNNTVEYNEKILVTSWAYGIQVMGGNNIIDSNKVIRGFRGISTSSGKNNTITNNVIVNLTAADYNNLGVPVGGEYGIVGTPDSIIVNNSVINSRIIATGAGLSIIDNSIAENNFIEVLGPGKGVEAGGSNVIIRNNTIITESGSGVHEKDEGSGLIVQNNTIISVSGVGILIEKLSSRRMPSNVTVIENTITTGNKNAIEASGVQADTSNIDLKSNKIIGSGNIISPAGVFDSSKPTYIFKGTTHHITPENIRDYINVNGGLGPEINDGDILSFEGTFSDEIIFITKGVKITGNSPIFYNSSFKITSFNVWIENLTIINKEATRVNAWGIFVNQGFGVRITNNTIKVNDLEAAYAIYVMESSSVEVYNNDLFSEGTYLTYTLLSYASESCEFANNTIHTVGTHQVHAYEPKKCLDGAEGYLEGSEFCLDGGHIVPEIYRTYGILMLYSSNNKVSGNDVNVTSRLNGTYPTTGANSSTNSIVGIDLYYNSHNNTFSNNRIYVKSLDNYIYGMGVLGVVTGHAVAEGQGASNNQFVGNEITLEGPYFTTGIIAGDASEGTVIANNTINLNSGAVIYGITLEMSQKSYIESNNLNLNSQLIYGIDGISSSDNVILANNITANAKTSCTVLISNGNGNVISQNLINSNGSGEEIPFLILDFISCDNSGVYIVANSAENIVIDNNITSREGYAVFIDDESTGNNISDNCLVSKMGSGNDAVDSSKANNVFENYKYVADMSCSPVEVKYLGTADFIFDFTNGADGGVVELYDGNGNFLNRTTVSNNRADLRFKFNESYISSQYLFSSKFIKDNFKSSTLEINLDILKGDLVIAFDNVTMAQGNTKNITAKVLDEFGNPVYGASVQFNRINSAGKATLMGKATTDKQGIASLSYTAPSSLEEGVHDIFVEVAESDNYNGAGNSSKLIILQRVDVTITPNSKIYVGGVLARLTDSNGKAIADKNVTVKLGTQSYSLVSNGNGEIRLPNSISKGSYSVNIVSAGEGQYGEASLNSKVTILSIITGNKDYSVYYGNTIKYKVRILDSLGKAVGKGKSVVFTINGKSKTVKTDANGYATYSIKLSAGKYTLSIKHNGYTVSNKITFKPTLTAKNISKKKAKTIKFSAKLVDKKGKGLKNKKVKFKVNGKTYSAKTNKKGVATASIKNLKVGKFTITSSYGGCTIKNTIQIKK